MRAIALHLAQHIRTRLGLRHQRNGTYQFLERLLLALFRIELENIAHMDEADDVINSVLVHRHPRKLFMNDKLAQIFYRFIGGNRNDVGPRRHHFANALIAERHHRLNQLAVFFGQNAFFLTGRDQGVDVLGGIGRVSFAVAVVIEFEHQRLEDADQSDQRRS